MELPYQDVGVSSDWQVMLFINDRCIYSGFEMCRFPMYKCLFSRMRVNITFNNFEVEVLNHLKISLSQLRPIS